MFCLTKKNLGLQHIDYIVSSYQGGAAQLGYFRKANANQKEVDVAAELPHEKFLCGVKCRNNSSIPAVDAIIELRKDENCCSLPHHKTAA